MARQRLRDRYTHEDLGVTKAEFNRLLQAVDDEIIHEGIAFSKRNIDMFKYGGMRIDDLIRTWSVRGYKDPFEGRVFDISQREFEEIVYEAAVNNPSVDAYKIEGATVYVKFYSRSRKQSWQAVLDFNDDGRYTRRFCGHRLRISRIEGICADKRRCNTLKSF
ncbi:MAG: hypothetical protein FWH04_00765 [Oscillospiraceae bacterium]|nr:hypothetical protein [Oscillospiraceae bacterium]